MLKRIALVIGLGIVIAALDGTVVLSGDWAPSAGRHAMFLATFCLLGLLTLSATVGPRGPRAAAA